MRVRQIVIKNILGIEDLTIEPGSLTVISGKNAAGKTSVLTALKDLVDGGHDPSLLRKGADQGSVTMHMDDGVEVFKVITPAKSVTTVVDPKFGKISKPATWIKETMDSLSLDPVQFLTMKPKPRVDMLLGALPIDLPMSEIGKLGIPQEFVAAVKVDQHPLGLLDELKSRIFSKRREINTMAREKRGTASQMRNTLPAEPEGEATDWKAEAEKLTANRDALQAQGNQMVHAARDKAQSAIDAAQEEAAQEIVEIEEETKKRVNAIKERHQAQVDQINAQTRETTDEIAAGIQPQLDSISEQLGQALERIEQEAKAAETRRMISEMEGGATTLETESATLTQCLDGLQGLKESKLQNLPIKDLALVDGDFEVGGIPFDRLNDAEKHRICIEVAKLKAGSLGLILMDRAEIFDGFNWESFAQMAVDSGLQVIAGKVSQDDLAVEARE